MKKIILSLFLFITFAEAQNKLVLFEMCLSTTCSPSAIGNNYFDKWFKSYAEQDKICVIKYHVWWPQPGNDPFYANNIDDNKSRTNYYGVVTIPYFVVNGKNVPFINNFSDYVPVIEQELLKPTQIKLNIEGNITGNHGNVQIKLETNNMSLPVGTIILHTAVVESELNYTGPNGDPVHNFVLRKMYPDSYGKVIQLSENRIFSYTSSIVLEDNWQKSNLELIAFVQVKEKREILQAAKIKISSLTGMKENLVNVPFGYQLSQNYPNPFNPETNITYKIPKGENVKLIVLDINGKEIVRLVDEHKNAGTYSAKFSIDRSLFSSGIYFCKMISGDFSKTIKMVILK